jgi:cobalt-zinc-cadmium efflux system outer membrane protein
MEDFAKKACATIWVIVFILLITPVGLRADTLIWAPEELGALIEEGLARNNEIQSLKDQVESLKDEIPFAGALDDPKLGFAILNLPTDTFSFNQEPMTQKQISLAQKFPWFGKLDLRSQRVTIEMIRQKAMLDAKQLELARKIAQAYYDLGFTIRSLEINQRLSEIVAQLLRVAETRYATGQGLQQDVLQAQVESSKLLDEKIMLEKRRRMLTDRINELLNRDRFMTVEPAAGLKLMHLDLNSAELTSMALQQNPQLRAKKADIDIADVEIELAKKDYWPDMEVKFAYGQRQEDSTGRDLPDFVSGQVVINVPLWYKTRQDSKLAATLKSRLAADNSYRNLAKSLPYQVDSLITQIQDIQKNYKLFTDALLLQADQWARSSQSAYEVGSLEFNTMISAQIRLLRFELQADNYLYEIYRKRAELEELVGSPID